MNFPGRSQLPADPHGRQIRRRQQTRPRRRRLHRYPERVAQARRSWPEARAEDFEKIGKRTYRDRGSGLELVALRGAPLLSIGQEETRGAACFLIEAGRIVVLRRPDDEQPLLGPEGRVYGQQIVAGNGPAGPRIL